MLRTMNSGMIGGPDTILRSPGLLTPEVQSLVDTVIKSVLDWAAQQKNSNRDSNSLGAFLRADWGHARLPNNLLDSPWVTFFPGCRW
jgi:hypothetical protein